MSALRAYDILYVYLKKYRGKERVERGYGLNFKGHGDRAYVVVVKTNK